MIRGNQVHTSPILPENEVISCAGRYKVCQGLPLALPRRNFCWNVALHHFYRKGEVCTAQAQRFNWVKRLFPAIKHLFFSGLVSETKANSWIHWNWMVSKCENFKKNNKYEISNWKIISSSLTLVKWTWSQSFTNQLQIYSWDHLWNGRTESCRRIGSIGKHTFHSTYNFLCPPYPAKR